MGDNTESRCGESSVFKGWEDCIYYIEEDKEIPTGYLNRDGYFIDDLGGGVLLIDDEDDRDGDEDEYWDEPSFDGGDFGDRPPRISIDCENDIKNMDLKAFSQHEIVMYDFESMEIVYKFYNSYALHNGFCARKSSIVRSKNTNEPYQQEYVCNREAKRRSNGKTVAELKREPRVDFRSFALQARGYQKIGFKKKDFYNQIHRQRREQASDVVAPLRYSHDMWSRDPMMYFEHTVDTELKKCLMGDNDLAEFQQLWDKMVCRTTSRCEGLHSELAKFVHSRYNLTDFLHHFQQCVEQMRFREKEDDFASLHGDPVLQTDFHSIERSAAKYLTKKVFYIFRSIMNRASDIQVVGCTKTLTILIYNVCKRHGGGKEWQVTQNPISNDFKCIYMRMESRGLACEHIIAVLGHLSILNLPRWLVLKRWSKGTKDGVQYYNGDGNNSWNASKSATVDDLMYLFSVLERLSNDTVDEYNKFQEKTLETIAESRARKASVIGEGSSTGHGLESLRDPVRGRPKGRGGGKSTTSGIAVRRRKKCFVCKVPDHNRLICPQIQSEVHRGEDGTGHTQEGDDELYYPTHDLDGNNVSIKL
ncbi:FAR1 DNA-binding domain [Sesbania bispinosa]|nr:FAR1 DNA-binding domain [Sesbania bispinosa]